jgi:hypothetical protein
MNYFFGSNLTVKAMSARQKGADTQLTITPCPTWLAVLESTVAYLA